MSKKFLALAGMILLLIFYGSCGNSEKTDADIETTAEENEETAVQETTKGKLTTGFSELDYQNYEFRIASFENENFHFALIPEEENGDTLNDALYKRNAEVEEQLKITIRQLWFADGTSYVSKCIKAGEDAFDIATVRCPDALTYWQGNMIVPMDNMPNVDLSKPYWNQSLNNSLSLNNTQYVAIGAFDVNAYDLTFPLVFNKSMVKDLGLQSPYEIVRSGEWTFDKMDELMKAAIKDVNGDDQMTDADQFGYLAHPKMVLPDFWISAGELSVSKDENDIPYLAMGNERFMSVFKKIFEITWDNKAWYVKNGIEDIPAHCIAMFSNGQSLFCDMSFFHMEKLRGMETDFGIIPYPKFDKDQERYYSRVTYYIPTIVPTTNKDLDRTGAIVEVLNCESANIVVPAYYDVALKTKFSRDDDSSEMLDLIFATRVVDIGDTTLCDKIRDGFAADMFLKNNRDIASKNESTQKIIDNFVKKIPLE